MYESSEKIDLNEMFLYAGIETICSKRELVAVYRLEKCTLKAVNRLVISSNSIFHHMD